MKIYREDALIIVVKAETQEELYSNAAASLEKYMKLHKYIDRKGR
jgi:hypothetical protein